MASTNGHSNSHSIDPAMGSYHRETQAIHSDSRLAKTTDIAPALHVSTISLYDNNPATLVPIGEQIGMKTLVEAPQDHYYTRLSSPNTARLEATLSALMKGRALTYASGLASFHAMLTYFNPKVIAIGDGYHGCHGVIKIIQRLSGVKKVDLDDEASWDAAGLGKGDIVHVETPLNPTGEAKNLEYYAELAHKRGAFLTVDATFGPPGLQDPFKHGADVIMHSGTKYLGGHSDMLCGVLVVQKEEQWRDLFMDRYIIGGVMGNLESWLGLRSIRTLELRVQRQSQNADNLVAWLNGVMVGKEEAAEAKAVRKTCLRVQHASLQTDDMHWLKKQMPNGFGPVFSLWMQTSELAKRLPSKLRLFHHTTSLGGVESLIEWRKMSDPAVDERVLRVSVGVEAFEDLRGDFIQAFEALLAES